MFLTPLLNFYIIVLGLIIGSFLNCLIWRLYKNESLFGRSYCPHCRHQIAWYDNIPVLSFLFLKGRCRHCRQKISWQYPLVEIVTALLFYLSFLGVASSAQFALELTRAWLLVTVLVVIFVYDSRWQLVPMNLIWPMTLILFLLNIFLGRPIISVVATGALTAGFFLLQYILTKKRGLGEGDIWLGLLLGVSFPSFPEIFLVLFLAYLSGAIVGLSLMLIKGKNGKMKIALGPFLAFGAIITLIWGNGLLAAYFRLFF
jgi:prepilin signal peptidase PulO-like enzyme (type II secretory pathway)